MVIFIKILQVILALSILIIVHEFGHFFWAKCFKIRVEKFYLFFDIGGKALVRWHWGGTEFGIGWLPFGGYCKISGMVDESMDLEHISKEPQSYEFRSKKAWQRLLVMVGGVVNNFIFAIICYICILAIWGQSFIPNEGNRIYVNELAYEMGFRNGDTILRYDDYTPSDFTLLQADMVRREAHNATILRGNDTISLYIDHSMFEKVLNSSLMFDLAIPFVIDSVSDFNQYSGLLKGDKIVAFNDCEVEFVQDSRSFLSDYKNTTINASVLRGLDTLVIPVKVDSLGRIGVYMQSPVLENRNYSLLEAIPAGLKYTGETIGSYVQDLKLLAKPSTGAYKSVGSFIAITQVFPSNWDWYRFINIIALLSIVLGVFNLIPIPGLDGGHIFFTLWEIISGRKPSDKFLIGAQMIGMLLLIALMVLAIGNDIGRLL